MGYLIKFKTVFIQTIMSQAWKETSLKVQRSENEATGFKPMPVIFSTSALRPNKY